MKRIMAGVRELSALGKSPHAVLTVFSINIDAFEWHFTLHWPPKTALAAVMYHGRVLLPQSIL